MKCILLFVLFVIIIFHSQEAHSQKIGSYSFIQFHDSTAEEYRPGNVKFIAAADSGKKIMAVSTTGSNNFYYYRSEDYGSSWEMFFKDTLFQDGSIRKLPQHVNCIEFPSEDYCVIGLDDGKLKVTEDFGQSWQLVETGYDYDIDELIMLDGLYGIAMLRHKVLDSNGLTVRLEKKMLKTTDGWRSWSEIELHNDLRGIWNKTLFMLGKENIGFLQGIENDTLADVFLFISNNGGESWQWSKVPDKIGSITFRTSTEIYAISGKLARFDSVWYRHRYHPVFMKSENNGTSWDTLSVRNDTIFAGRNLEFIDENTGFVMLSLFRRYLTDDGGRSWNLQNDYQIEMRKKYSGLYDYDIINENYIVYAAGTSIVIYDNQSTSVLETEEPGFAIYPNPADAEITIRFPSPRLNHSKLLITDILGRHVYTKELVGFDGDSNIATINTSLFPQGTYFVTLFTGEKSHTEVITIIR